MNSDILRSAEPLKCIIIDYLTKKYPNCIIGNEVMYGTKKKVVDLLLINDSRLYAIEIKGDNDNLKLLEGQIQEYEKVFDYITVFSTPKHLELLKNSLPEHIGLYLIEGENIIPIQKEKKSHKLDKKEMLYSISTSFLHKEDCPSNKNSDDTRSYFSKKNKEYIHELLVKHYVTRYTNRFDIFLKEKGKKTHIDDINLLSSNVNIST